MYKRTHVIMIMNAIDSKRKSRIESSELEGGWLIVVWRMIKIELDLVDLLIDLLFDGSMVAISTTLYSGSHRATTSDPNSETLLKILNELEDE